MTVVAFIIMPAPSNNYNVESLKGQAVTKSLRDTVKDVQAKIGRRIFDAALKCVWVFVCVCACACGCACGCVLPTPTRVSELGWT